MKSQTLMEAKKKRISSAYSMIPEVSMLLREYLELNGVQTDTINNIELALIEAINNVIKHSYAGSETGIIDVEWDIIEKTIEIRITDYGKSRKNFERPELKFDADDIETLPEGGMGLYIIDNLMDENIYTKTGNKNTYTLVKMF